MKKALTTQASAIMNVNVMVDGFLVALDVTHTTRSSYRKKVKAFLDWLLTENIRQPKRADVLRFKAALIAQGKSPLTVSAYLTAVRSLFKWLESEGQYPDITAGIKGAKKPHGFRKDALTVAQVKDVLGGIENKRDYAILNLLFRTGLRTIEVARATIGDIRQEGGEAILYIQGKGRDAKDEFVLLTWETLKPIYAYLATRGHLEDSAPLFASESNNARGKALTTRAIRGIVKRYFKRAGLNNPKLTAHSTRHTFATVALSNGAEVIQLKDALRHKNIETTMIYAHNMNRIKNGAERFVAF